MTKTLRCAIYTRKSSEEGLEQDFNSLHAQREACESYIKSQKHEGWQVVKTAYDDGGISGGTMDRPALQQLLVDIRNRRVDVVVVYKVDRLTRSLTDFSKIVEIFDAASVSFVSVTQQFNTTSSMGRLTLNVLLSFAQFEREVTGERIRDKIAASKKKGIWMGGPLPLGYEVKERKLLIKPHEADVVRTLYRRYLELGCVRLLEKDAAKRGFRSAKGEILSRDSLYRMLSNPLYIGQLRHKGICHPGQQEAILDLALWDQVRQRLTDNRVGSKTNPRKTEPSPMAGRLFDVSGERLVPVHANKQGRRYRYYISRSLMKNPKDEAMSGWRLPAQEIEQTAVQVIGQMLQDRDAIIAALGNTSIDSRHLQMMLASASEADNATLIERFIQRLELGPNGIRLTLSLASLMPENELPITLTRDLPMRMKRRGVEMRMVIGNAHPPHLDPVLIKTIGLAKRWYDEFISGALTLTEIATRHHRDKGDVSRMMGLAFLAPDIVDDIVSGRQPPELTARKLLRQSKLPLDWAEQRQLLGYH